MYPIDVGHATPQVSEECSPSAIFVFELLFLPIQIYYYKIPSDVKLVTVDASSDVFGCTIVSIQNNTVRMHCRTINTYN